MPQSIMRQIPQLLHQDNTPINSTKDLIEAYSDQFDRIGNFAGEYHIVFRPSNHPIVHAPRKCLIHMRDEVKAELDEVISQGIIQKVDEPTDWVSSIVYVCKSNSKLCLCLDPKVLNKATKLQLWKSSHANCPVPNSSPSWMQKIATGLSSLTGNHSCQLLSILLLEDTVSKGCPLA